MVADINRIRELPFEVEAEQLTSCGDVLCFLGLMQDGRWGWYRTDGTNEGTRVIGEEVCSRRAEDLRGARSTEEAVYIRVVANDGEPEWYRYNGADLARVEVAAVPVVEGPSREPAWIEALREGDQPQLAETRAVQAGDHWYFAANDAAHGTELWMMRADWSGPRLVADLYPGPASSQPEELTVLGDHIFFRAESPESGVEVFMSDGTPEGTHCVRDMFPGRTGSAPASLTAWNGWVWFVCDTKPTPQSQKVRLLCRTNGESTVDYPSLESIEKGPDNLTVAGNRLYLTAPYHKFGEQIRVIEGDGAGGLRAPRVLDTLIPDYLGRMHGVTRP
jgi:ELWxxDGT repeat protein